MSSILHLSDTHLQRSNGNVSRAPDHDSTFAEILTVVKERKPDLVLHTGDLFDIPRPSVEEMNRAISILREFAVHSHVVVVCGNHESPKLFALFDTLLGKDSRIHFVSEMKAPSRGGILEFPTQDGHRLRLAPMPFIHTNRVIADEVFNDSGTWLASYADKIAQYEGILGRGLAAGATTNDIALFAAHLHVAGASWSGSERPNHISDAYGSKAESIPAVSYAALGHLHKPQDLPGHVPGRFVGSPFQMDFGEEGEAKSIVWVEALPGRRADISRIPLTSARTLHRLTGTLEEIRPLAATMGRNIVKVTVKTKTHTPYLSDIVREMMPEAAVLNVEEDCADRKLTVLSRKDAEAEIEQDFAGMFADFLKEQGTKGASADSVMHTFKSLVQAVQDDVVPHFPEEDLVVERDLLAPLNLDDDI